MVHFSTSSKFGIVTADPTSTLEDFDVTPITYQHLLLETKQSKKTPVFLGPVLTRYWKTFTTYLFLCHHLLGCLCSWKVSEHLAQMEGMP